ncbi:fluoride efflux transporter CrcB [Bacillus sp. AFS015802]|uniref:fluoride efflux transporter CrcB n=1 Tax=Bacillus sp. AFS015802 TaxID=2033486 RepID=UPI000BF2FF2E|nr:fluoride efflux transporter CrcB [Bacillus sp. AFS015802]PFA67663.1 fluoride efflux transporter CrcB [Bacillus sp. AFS015802]
MIVQGMMVALGGFFGAMSRFWISRLFKKYITSDFPYATLCVNLIGSFLLGFVIGTGINESGILLLGTGFLGAFTTFSTFKLENIQLLADRKWKLLITYLLLSYTFGVSFAYLGVETARLYG